MPPPWPPPSNWTERLRVSTARVAAVAALPNRWNLGTEDFTGVVIEFSADGQQWEAQPKDLTTLHYARVTAPDNHVKIMFLRAVGGPPVFTVPARAVASTKPVRLTE